MSSLANFWRKNRGLFLKPAAWGLMFQIIFLRGRRFFVPSAQALNPRKVFISTHHKAMTTYFHAVLRILAWSLRLEFDLVDATRQVSAKKVVLFMHGKHDLDRLRPYRGVHVMRDPRDMIVSGYHYHKWTSENWVKILDDSGFCYQEKINSSSKRDGLLLETQHFINFYGEVLNNWDVNDPDILEVSYESLMGDRKRELYSDIFSHLGFQGRELTLACDLMRLFEAGSRSGKANQNTVSGQHLRSGASGQWTKELEHEHLDLINSELGDVLRKFGYALHEQSEDEEVSARTGPDSQ